MKLSSRRVKVLATYLIPVLVGVGVFALFIWIDGGSGVAVRFYQDKMRGSLFAGFLTLGSFLLSLKTGIVIKIKENVYDQPKYQERVVRAMAGGSETSFYGPLQRLSRVLATAVFSALLASILQLTVGLFSNTYATALCLAAAAVALSFLLIAFTLIQISMQQWFGYLEDAARKKKTEAKAA